MNMLGCWGWAIMGDGAAGGAAMGVWRGGGGGAGAGLGGGDDIRGGEAALPRRGILANCLKDNKKCLDWLARIPL